MARRAFWLRILGYGAFLAAGTLALQWLDYRFLMQQHAEALYVSLVATGFLALGVWLGARAFRKPVAPRPFDGNPQALAALRISARELTVLHELAAGRSNKEIARALAVSPNTVKTHVARLYGKLEAKRRTDAVRRARELGLLE